MLLHLSHQNYQCYPLFAGGSRYVVVHTLCELQTESVVLLAGSEAPRPSASPTSLRWPLKTNTSSSFSIISACSHIATSTSSNFPLPRFPTPDAHNVDVCAQPTLRIAYHHTVASWLGTSYPLKSSSCGPYCVPNLRIPFVLQHYGPFVPHPLRILWNSAILHTIFNFCGYHLTVAGGARLLI